MAGNFCLILLIVEKRNVLSKRATFLNWDKKARSLLCLGFDHFSNGVPVKRTNLVLLLKNRQGNKSTKIDFLV